MALTKQQKELVALGVLGVAAVSLWYAYFRPQGLARASAGMTVQAIARIDVQDYFWVLTGLEKAQNTEYKSAGRNIFVMGPIQTATATATGPVKAPFRIYNQPQPPPPPPPATLPTGWVFYGYGALPASGRRQAFLKEGPPEENLHIVSEGDLVQNHIRILHIGNERIDFEDINTGQKGSQNLETPPQA